MVFCPHRFASAARIRQRTGGGVFFRQSCGTIPSEAPSLRSGAAVATSGLYAPAFPVLPRVASGNATQFAIVVVADVAVSPRHAIRDVGRACSLLLSPTPPSKQARDSAGSSATAFVGRRGRQNGCPRRLPRAAAVC